LPSSWIASFFTLGLSSAVPVETPAAQQRAAGDLRGQAGGVDLAGDHAVQPQGRGLLLGRRQPGPQPGADLGGGARVERRRVAQTDQQQLARIQAVGRRHRQEALRLAGEGGRGLQRLAHQPVGRLVNLLRRRGQIAVGQDAEGEGTVLGQRRAGERDLHRVGLSWRQVIEPSR
jgi:hypothetical protein